MSHRRVVLLIAILGVAAPVNAFAQKITVKAATPPSGTQGTASLNVKITGSGFAPGAKAEFLKSGTVDPDGIKVNTTSYISNTELTANIDIADTAALSLFDIKVSAAGRSGKGTDLFRVDPHEEVCAIPQSDPGHFQFVSALNGVVGSTPRYAEYLGASLAAAVGTIPLPDASTREVLIVFSGTLGTGNAEIFFLDPLSGDLLDGTSFGGGAAIQPHLTVLLPYTPTTVLQNTYVHRMLTADLNVDGIPDAVTSDNGFGMVAGLLSHVSANGQVSFTAVPLPSTGEITFGASLAIADVDGEAGLEIVAIEKDQSTRKTSSPPRAFVFRLAADGSSFALVYTLVLSVLSDDNFGNTIAVGDVTGDGRPDLVGGAPYRDVNRIADAGAVLVFPGTGAQPPYRFSATPILLTASAPVKNERLGNVVFLGNSSSDPTGQIDVIALSEAYAAIGTVPPSRGLVFRGPVTTATKETPSDTFGPPSDPLGKGWGTAWRGTPVADLDQDGLADLIVPASGADVTPACTFRGAVYAFFAQADAQGRLAGWQRATLYQPTDDAGSGSFGNALAWVPGASLLIVGNPGFTVGGLDNAGQIYVYRVF